ncbi:hypothetical protein ATANTOWER_003911 [Ataeniobius toweri]|uniref:Ankyrin repeat domain-containing protein 12 n=1 Tax=Ataeniobius toweri TaxID=208326 RepID=A0ABU7BWR2_9TELE|nr:hypothetical protein [Ataeniobius toweri]
MAKPGGDRDGAMVDKQAGKKSKDKLSPFTKTPKLDRGELLGKEGKAKSSMKRKLSFTTSPPRTEERDSDTDDSDPGQSSETWGERLVPPCRIYADKDGPEKKKVKKEPGSRRSQSSNLLFGYPLSERKQMALLMQMTANSPDSTPSHPSQTTPRQKKVPSSASSRQKDKVNKRNERGETPLHMAAIRGDAKQVKELISLGADVNVKDFAGWTPLHEACNLGYYDVAKVLIAAGAEVNTQGLDDDTPLHDASSSGHKDIVKLLLRHGGNAFQANKRGERPVDVADSQELEQLLKGEASLSDQDDSSSESEDPPSVNPSSVDDNMEDSDTEKETDSKPTTKASSSVPGMDEQKETRKDGHRNLEFDREFWKENFFKSDEADEPLAAKKDCEDISSVQKPADSPPKDERNSKEKHSGSKEKKLREEREKDKVVKKERKESAGKEEKTKDSKPSECDEKVDGHGSGQSPEELLQNSSMKEEMEEKPITADQEQLDPSEKASRDKPDKRLPGKEKDSDKIEKRHLDKEKKIKLEHSEKAEPQSSVDRWKEKDRTGTLSPGDKSYRENEKLKSLSAAKKHEDGRKNKDKLEKRSDREYSAGDHKERDRANSDRRGKPLEKSMDHSKSDRLKEKDCDRKKKDKIKDSSVSSSSNLKLLLEDKRSGLSESSKVLSTKSKEEALKTPEKDRDRRDRERDYDRHKDKDKDRHKDRSQQVRINKAKPGEGDADKSKPKNPTATRDAKPKEKRLVNDDLMQTSFERMLSMKDQEIELWHRKHLEKIKQKERERLKQRPLYDPGKSKPKDRTKPELCLNKELTRSKSSEASDVHGREKSLKDGANNRTLSLDGKSVPTIGTKVISVVDNCLSRSPRPESDRGGLMSRSVSLVSVASSEESYQAATLTPRHTEYDSDMNLETSDSQQAFLQSSLVIQASRSPSVHDRDCNSPPDVPQSNQTPLSGKHEPQYLQSVLEEHPRSSAEGDGAEHPSTCGLTNTSGEEPKTKETSEPDESLSSQQNLNPSADPVMEKEESTAGWSATQLPGKDLPNKNQMLPELDASQAEQKTAPFPEPAVEKDVSCPTETSQGECGSKESDQPLTSGESLPLTDATTFQQREMLPSSSTENQSDVLQVPGHHDKLVENPVHENMDAGSDNPTPEGAGSPLPTTSLHIPSSTEEFPAVQEDTATDNPDKSQPSTDDVGPCPDVQMEDATSSVTPEPKAEEASDALPSSEDSGAVAATTESSSLEESKDGSYEPKAEIPLEPMEVTPADDKTESSAAEEQSPSFVQSAPQTDSSNASGNSSPQSGDRDSDSSGAKLKVRPADEDMDVHVPHPRKRKMPKLSNSQLCSTTQLEKEKCQQSLAAIVDSVKLEEIEPYQTERANPYYEFLHIRKKIEEKRKVLCNVTPQPPQYYDEYVTFNGSYLLDGNPLSKLCIPTITPPPSLPEPLKEMFKQQEVVRMKLRLQHSIEREKLIVSNEQEVLRVHYRAARTLANQTLPFSACTVLLDAEVYNMPQDIQNDDGKTSVRDRFNARQFMSWLQDVDDKFDKLKTCLLMRQQHEAAALNAVQRLEWQLKLQELDPATYKSTSIFEIPEFYIPLVEVNDDFDLTPI